MSKQEARDPLINEFCAWHQFCVIPPLIMTEEDPNSQSRPPQGESNTPFEPVEPVHPTGPPLSANNFKERIQGWGTRIDHHLRQSLNKDSLKKMAQDFDPQAFSSWVTKAVQNRGATFYGTLLTIVLSTYFISDLTSLLVGEYIPEPPPSKSSRFGNTQGRSRTLQDYGTIFTRNLFNSQGLIPGEDTGVNSTPSDLGGAPVKTSLPLNLVGTLIMNNELRSIATIEDKPSSIVYPVRIDDEIPNKIRIIKIEPRKVTFVNKSNGRREYIDLPEDAAAMVQNPRITVGGPGIEKLSSTQFNVSRSEVDKALADFNNILTQARAVPNFENGVASGYKLFQIVPGSIYDKLGLQNGDVISGVNGSPINDPGKAFEMLSDLKTSNHLELQVKKDGKLSTYTYDIR